SLCDCARMVSVVFMVPPPDDFPVLVQRVHGVLGTQGLGTELALARGDHHRPQGGDHGAHEQRGGPWRHHRAQPVHRGEQQDHEAGKGDQAAGGNRHGALAGLLHGLAGLALGQRDLVGRQGAGLAHELLQQLAGARVLIRVGCGRGVGRVGAGGTLVAGVPVAPVVDAAIAAGLRAHREVPPVVDPGTAAPVPRVDPAMPSLGWCGALVVRVPAGVVAPVVRVVPLAEPAAPYGLAVPVAVPELPVVPDAPVRSSCVVAWSAGTGSWSRSLPCGRCDERAKRPSPNPIATAPARNTAGFSRARRPTSCSSSSPLFSRSVPETCRSCSARSETYSDMWPMSSCDSSRAAASTLSARLSALWAALSRSSSARAPASAVACSRSSSAEWWVDAWSARERSWLPVPGCAPPGSMGGVMYALLVLWRNLWVEPRPGGAGRGRAIGAHPP